MIKSILKFGLIFSFLFLFTTESFAQCPPTPFTNASELLIAGYHSTIAKTTTGYEVWGDKMGANGVTIYSHQDVTPANGYNYTGSILLATQGDAQSAGDPQSFLLTTTGLYVWGSEGAVIDNTLTTSATFQSIGLPGGVASADISYMTASFGVLALLTNSGDVYVIADDDFQLFGDASAAIDNAWHQATISNVALLKATEEALYAVTTAGDFYTWGRRTMLADGTGFSARNTPTLMTAPFAAVPSMIAITGGNSGAEDVAYFALNSLDSKIYCVGDNDRGQLGIGNTTEATAWQVVQKPAAEGAGDFENVVFLNAANVSSGHPAASAITSDGTAYLWGDNSSNMLSDAAAAVQSLPIVPSGFVQGVEFATYTANSGHYTLVKKFGSVRPCFVGHRSEGNVGDGMTGDSAIPQLNCGVFPLLDYCFSSVVEADLVTVKTVDKAYPTEGATINYTITITNNGPDDVTGVNLTDVLPGGIAFVSAAPTGGTVNTYNTGTGLWTVGDLANTDVAQLTIVATVNASTIGTTITNTTTKATGDNMVDAIGTGDILTADVKPQLDTDNDGIVDIFDVDDDNDGILDVVEKECGGADPYGATNFITNPDFSALPAGSPAMGEWIIAPGNDISGWTSSVPYRGNNVYPPDTEVSQQSGDIIYSIGGLIDIVNQVSFPGDATFGVPASATYLYSNGNTTGAPYTIWEQTINGLTENTAYVYYAYTSNAIKPSATVAEAPDNGMMQFLVNGSPIGTAFEVFLDGQPESGHGGVDLWDRRQVFFTTGPGQTSVVLSLQDSQLGDFGDDFVITAVSARVVASCADKDFDLDGIPDHLDLDSDNDGIPDIVEAGGVDVNEDGKVDAFVDEDGDGWHDPIAVSPLPTPNTDGTGKPDYKDTDADDDGCFDSMEAGSSDGDFDGVAGTGAFADAAPKNGWSTATDTSEGGAYPGNLSDYKNDAVSTACTPQLTVTKTITTAGTQLNDVIAYDIIVKNTGNVTITDIAVADANADGGSMVGSPIATLAPGASATVTVEQTISAVDITAGFIENSATATGDSPSGTDDVTDVSDTDVDANGDPIANNETVDGDDADIDPKNDPTKTNLESPELTVTKTITTAGAVLNDVIEYDIVVENTGDVTITDIVVTDANADGAVTGSPIATLAVGASATVTVAQTITQADINAGFIENSATATGDSPSGTDDVTDVSDTDVDANGDPIANNETVDGDDVDTDPTNDPTLTTLHPNPIDAIDDTGITIATGTGGVAVADVLADNGNGTDLLGGVAVVLADVNLTQVSTTNAGVTLDPVTGAVNVTAGTPAGDYTLVYRICEKANPTNCDDASVTVVVADNPIVAEDDSFTATTQGGVIGDVTDNDLLGGVAVTDADITITVDDDGGIGATIDADGNLTIPADVPPGTYTVDYTICENANPTNCDPATVTIVVADNPIVAEDDSFNGTATGGVIGDVTDNDLLNGVAVTDADIDITVDDDGGIGASIDADGNLSIPANTPAGTYTVDYTICEKANPTNCDPATVTITIPVAALKFYSGFSPEGGNQLNNYWRIDGILEFPENEVKIFNRWGNLVYQVRGYDNNTRAWRGQSTEGTIIGEKIVPDGSYFYVVDLGDGTKVRSGYIVIYK